LIVATLNEILNNNQILTRSQLKADRGLVREIQLRLRNLGLYPGGQWIDGDLGGNNSFSWKGLKEFCEAVNLSGFPSDTVSMNIDIATKLLETKQLPFILDQARNTNFILEKLTDIQSNTPSPVDVGVTEAFVARTTRNSPFAGEIANYPQYLAQKPDGTSIISYGNSFTLSSGTIVTFSNYPHQGQPPMIDPSGLDFLSPNISHACLCVGSFEDGNSPIITHWLGKKALEPVQFLSATKFIGVLNAISQINGQFPIVDVDDCIILSPRFRFNELLINMLSYGEDARGNIGRSNQIGALFKRFTKREDLEAWMKAQTGNHNLEFRGGYFNPPLISNPQVKDTVSGTTVLSHASTPGDIGENLVSAYDLVRLISMLGWHLHLTANTQLPDAQWNSLESVVRAMGMDIARYVDVALETLGVIDVISEPVVISKVGWGASSFTYVAFVKFVDRRLQPAKLRTFAIALRTPNGSHEVRDNHLAAAVTEIVRRSLTEELA
jgi:peptidoglycan hydrolase-like protein with peptidoglycan-binding domain